MMKLAPTVMALLLATACTGNATPAEESTRARPVPSSAAGTSATAPESPTPTTTPASDPSPTAAPTTATETAEPSAAPPEQPPADASGPVLSPRGNLVKQIGEEAGIIDGNGERLVNFVINSISSNVVCTQELAEPAENGLFVAVHVSVQTSPAMAAPDAFISTFEMAPWMFSAISPEGISSNANPDTFASFLCLDDSALLPSSIGPGENAEGIVLLDLQHPSGILVFEDFYTDSAWEWTYPG